MISVAKVLIPNKEWLIRNDTEKVGSIAKANEGYIFLHKGITINLPNLTEIKSRFGISLLDNGMATSTEDISTNKYSIYDFPCSSEPFEPMYSIKEKLPLYLKSNDSKSKYCAGYYIIQFKKGWVKSYCPKVITLERYPYRGPFKTEFEAKSFLTNINKL